MVSHGAHGAHADPREGHGDPCGLMRISWGSMGPPRGSIGPPWGAMGTEAPRSHTEPYEAMVRHGDTWGPWAWGPVGTGDPLGPWDPMGWDPREHNNLPTHTEGSTQSLVSKIGIHGPEMMTLSSFQSIHSIILDRPRVWMILGVPLS